MHFPDVTPDLLLTSVFGGFFIGAGIGLAVRGGGVLDGTEIAALLISKRSHLLKAGDVILIFNVVLFLAAMRVLGVEPALYSILTYVTAARTLDFVIYGLEEYTAITIVSSQSAAIRERITGELERGVTVYRGYGGLTGAEQEILYCVVTRLEIGKVKAIVRAVDQHAFIVSHVLADAEGGVVKRAAAALGRSVMQPRKPEVTKITRRRKCRISFRALSSNFCYDFVVPCSWLLSG